MFLCVYIWLILKGYIGLFFSFLITLIYNFSFSYDELVYKNIIKCVKIFILKKDFETGISHTY